MYLTVFETIMANSSKLSLPSPSLSASMIVLSTICCSWWSYDISQYSILGILHSDISFRTFKLLPTIIFNTKNSSPLEMKPSRSISYTLNATVGY